MAPRIAPILSLTACLLCAGTLAGQGRPGATPEQIWGPVRGEASGVVAVAFPIGEFEEYVDLGGGVAGYGIVYFDDRRTAGLRLDASWLIYGSRTVRRPLSPTVPFVDVDVSTQNWIAGLGVGPQIETGTGALRPYLHGSVGFSYFATTTSVEGTHNTEPFASSTNFDDFTLALVGGGGVRVRLATARRNPLSLDLGVDYVRNGLTEYLREGGLRERAGGGVEIRPIRSETNLMLVRIGMAVGLR